MHEHSLARCEIGENDRHNSRRENNESALCAPGETPVRKLLHHSGGKARSVGIGRLVTQSRIEQVIKWLVYRSAPNPLAFSSISGVRPRHWSSPTHAPCRGPATR